MPAAPDAIRGEFEIGPDGRVRIALPEPTPALWSDVLDQLADGLVESANPFVVGGRSLDEWDASMERWAAFSEKMAGILKPLSVRKRIFEAAETLWRDEYEPPSWLVGIVAVDGQKVEVSIRVAEADDTDEVTA